MSAPQEGGTYRSTTYIILPVALWGVSATMTFAAPPQRGCRFALGATRQAITSQKPSVPSMSD